ncbi:MAG: redoxin domain-containing protein, partial [Caldilinea sp.]|nr:redoxin domain-containing protein [Caldilinea sp.]
MAGGFLQVGDVAPDFVLPDVLGNAVALGDLRAQGPVALSFYRGAWCPYC